MASRSDYLGFHLKRDWRREGGNWREAAQEGAPSESEEGTSTGILADLQRGCGSVSGALAEPRPRAAWGSAPWGELGWCGESCPRPPSNDPNTQQLPQRTSILSRPGGRKPETDGPAGPVPGGAEGTLPQASLPACRPPVEPWPAQGPLQALPALILSSFPEPVSSPLSCEDPVTPACPVRGNRLNDTSATTPFQMGSQMR